jgi:gluconolactonase
LRLNVGGESAFPFEPGQARRACTLTAISSPAKALRFHPNTRIDGIMEQANLLTLTNLGHLLDHPEAVAWGPDQRVYAGGEDGQVYRCGIDGKGFEQFAKVAGGFVLGMAHDADGNVYACDERHACVHKITPAGEVSVYSTGNSEQRMRVPNYPVFDDAGNLYVSDSGEFGKKNGWIWRVRPGGHAEIWDRSASGFPNGMCLSVDGRTLFVVESSPPLISKLEIRADGSPGARSVLVELPRQVPDGVALDMNGDLLSACSTQTSSIDASRTARSSRSTTIGNRFGCSRPPTSPSAARICRH